MQSKIRFHSSIFLKLIILVIVFVVLVNLSIGFIARSSFERDPNDLMNSFIHLESQRIASEMSFPPDTLQLRRLIKEPLYDIRIESGRLDWTTDNEMLHSAEVLKMRDMSPEGNRPMLRDNIKQRGRPYHIGNISGGYIIISPKPPREELNLQKAIISIAVLITLLTGLLFIFLRWIFGPIKKLSEAVSSISRGNFDTKISIDRKDELGNLAMKIDEMKTSIATMIKAKESLLIDVSHELRSPLTRIKLANELSGDERIKDKISEDVKEMEVMITALLETYRIDAASGKLNPQKTDLAEFVREIVAKYGESGLHVNTTAGLKEAVIDREKISVVLVNLIDNAIKYSDSKPVEITIGPSSEAGAAIIKIKDYGVGIHPDELSKIFEPFYRTDKSRDKKISGFGLGLSIVKKILAVHNSDISVSSTPSFGSEFVITLRNLTL